MFVLLCKDDTEHTNTMCGKMQSFVILRHMARKLSAGHLVLSNVSN